MSSIDDPSNETEHLRRRVIIGNVIGYAGMLGAVSVYLSDGPTHPLLYGLTGAAVGLGAGLAYLSLWKLRQLRRIAQEDVELAFVSKYTRAAHRRNKRVSENCQGVVTAESPMAQPSCPPRCD